MTHKRSGEVLEQNPRVTYGSLLSPVSEINFVQLCTYAYLNWPAYVHCPLAQVIWGQCITSFLPLLIVIPTVTSSPTLARLCREQKLPAGLVLLLTTFPLPGRSLYQQTTKPQVTAPRPVTALQGVPVRLWVPGNGHLWGRIADLLGDYLEPRVQLHSRQYLNICKVQ